MTNNKQYNQQVMSKIDKSDATIDARDVCKSLCRCVVNAVDEEDKEDMSVLRHLKKILSADGVSPNPDSSKEIGPLYLAAKLNLESAAKILLNHGASMVAESNGETPLEVAIRLKNRDVLNLFLRKIGGYEKDSPVGEDVVAIDFPNLDDVEEEEEEEEKVDDESQQTVRMWTHTYNGHLRSQDRVEKRIHRKEEQTSVGRRRRPRRASTNTVDSRNSKRQRVDDEDEDVPEMDMDEEDQQEEEEGEDEENSPALSRQWTHSKMGHTRSQDLVEKRIHRMNTQERIVARNLRRSSRRRK